MQLQRHITKFKRENKMIKSDDIMLSSAEFMALVEKCEAEAVKNYKKSTPETREHYIIIEVPLHKSLYKKGVYR